jgi:hypothetical protein
MEIPAALSPIAPDGATPALAVGPFVVERTDDDGTLSDIGFLLRRADERMVEWEGSTHMHRVRPSAEPVVSGNVLTFTQPTDGARYVVRPLESTDSVLIDLPDDTPALGGDTGAVTALAELIWSQHFGEVVGTPAGEDNLYLTRAQDGEPVALVKMSASHPTLVRQDGGWRLLADDEDDLLGSRDVPVKADAVTAWDAGNIVQLESLLMDDRFSPIDVTNLWIELDGDTDKIKRLLAERSRNRFYERTKQGTWAPAQPDPDAVTVDVVWSAIGAWDTGDLDSVADVEDYDTEGDAA